MEQRSLRSLHIHLQRRADLTGATKCTGSLKTWLATSNGRGTALQSLILLCGRQKQCAQAVSTDALVDYNIQECAGRKERRSINWEHIAKSFGVASTVQSLE